jgi:hypothetical protein
MVAAALLGTMVYLFLNTSTELAPEEDVGFMFSGSERAGLRHLRIHPAFHASRW